MMRVRVPPAPPLGYSMRIELEEPFKSKYRLGYLRRDSRGRGRVDLVNTDTDRTTVSYARYLVSVQEGRFLEEWEEVDHIDGNPSNDSLSNLQILSTSEHIVKTVKERPPRKKLSLVCPQCSKVFERWANQVGGRTNVFCSRSCNAKYTRARGKWLGNSK